MNSLKTLINSELKQQGLTRGELAIKLGYKNINKAVRAVNNFTDYLKEKNNIKVKLQRALNIPDSVFNNAITQVQNEIDARAKAQFKPMVQVIPSSRPSPIFVAAFFPQLWHVQIPEECKDLPFNKEIDLICEAYKQHQLTVNEEKAKEAGNDFITFIKNIEALEADRGCLRLSVCRLQFLIMYQCV